MKLHRLGCIATAVSCLGIVLPTSALAAAPPATTQTAATTAAAAPATSAPAAASTSDVALRTGGLLVGQVVDKQGQVKGGTPVSIQFGGKEVVQTTTDANGVFAAKGLRGGQYQLLTPQGGSVCRLWVADTAPPSAKAAALIVSGNEVVRGQEGGPMNTWKGWIKCHPYITAGTVAAAIAIPLVIADDDFDSGS